MGEENLSLKKPDEEGQPSGPQDIECQKCKGRFQAVLPQATVLNHQLFSEMIFVHEHPVVCPACGARHTYTLANVQYALQVVLLPEQVQGVQGNGGRIIIPPANVKIPRTQ